MDEDFCEEWENRAQGLLSKLFYVWHYAGNGLRA